MYHEPANSDESTDDRASGIENEEIYVIMCLYDGEHGSEQYTRIDIPNRHLRIDCPLIECPLDIDRQRWSPIGTDWNRYR